MARKQGKPRAVTDAPRVKLPGVAQGIALKYPQLWQAYQALGEEASRAGPLDERTRRLVHLYGDRLDWTYLRQRTREVPEESTALESFAAEVGR